MDKDKLKDQLKKHEGYRDKTYRDSLGFLTGGIGHLIVGSDLRVYKNIGMPIEKYIIDKWFEDDINKAIDGAKRLVPNFDELSDIRQRAIVDLVFNLGENKFSKFTNTLKYINSGKWDKAADGLLDSLWAKQVKNRSINIVEMIRNDKELT